MPAAPWRNKRQGGMPVEVKLGDGRTALITIAAGIISAAGTVGVAYLSGVFDVAKTDASSRGSLNLEKLQFSNELVKTALTSNNPANSLLFYADIGLLDGLEIDHVKSYAERETARLDQGGAGASLLPSFDKSSRPALWLDRAFFEAFAPDASPEAVDALVSTGNYLLTGFAINASPQRLAFFLGQIATETGGIRLLEESANYSTDRLVQIFPRQFDREKAEAYANQPERILNLINADRIGNGPESSGDGWRYRGRGFLMFTGRSNYSRISDETGVDLVKNPDLLSDPHVALLVTASYWYNAGLNDLADAGDDAAITRKLIGSTAGLQKRREYTQNALALLQAKIGVSGQ